MAKVIKKFYCKEQKKIFRQGDDYKASKTRVEQLIKLGFVETEAKPAQPKESR